MINKEEIEEYKQTLRNEKVLFGIQKDVCLHARVSVEKLVEYIEQLEKDKENIYWQGYIKKQQESVEICKICKYRDKYRQLEADLYEANNIINDYIEDRQKLINYLEKEIEVNRKEMNNTNIKLNQIHFMKRIEYAKEILEMAKGEKNE